jgi:cupin 2 domain-containing protein
MEISNLFSLKNVPPPGEEEFFEPLCEHGDLKIERIISRGHTSARDFWYEQDKHEWVVLLKGEARIEFEDGREVHLEPGNYLFLPSGLKHRVCYTSKETETVWLAIHFGSRQ